MNHLLTYVKAIYGLPSLVKVIEVSCIEYMYKDGDLDVNHQSFRYLFDNGVQVRFKTEWDTQGSNEGWMSYQVVESNNHSIEPNRQIFFDSNLEQEWIYS